MSKQSGGEIVSLDLVGHLTVPVKLGSLLSDGLPLHGGRILKVRRQFADTSEANAFCRRETYIRCAFR